MATNSNDGLNKAARCLDACWRNGSAMDNLEPAYRPATIAAGYAVQAALAELRGERVRGWKIAATAEAGRRHINVTHPLGGRLFESCVLANGAAITLGANRMRVAEAEFVLMLGVDLPASANARTEAEVAKAVSAVHPGLEIPDSRFADFTAVGAACLIADDACASQFVLGPASAVPDDLQTLCDCPGQLWVNGTVVTKGVGRDALGGPLIALTWLVNTLGSYGIGLQRGQFVTTGVVGSPSAIAAGDRIRVDLGPFGNVHATLAP